MTFVSYIGFSGLRLWMALNISFPRKMFTCDHVGELLGKLVLIFLFGNCVERLTSV